MNYDLLFATKNTKKLELAVIGVQGFNHSLFLYGSRHENISIRILCGRNVQKCVDAYRSIGVNESDIVHCNSADEGRDAFRAGKYLVFNDVPLAMTMPFDIVIEGTGNPEASAVHVLAAIENRKHVIMVTKESDSVAGPLLALKARQQGVIYSLAEGDQPALLIGLVSWARAAGLKILSIGKSSEYDFIYNAGDSTVTVLDTTLSAPDFASLWDLEENAADTLKKRSEALSLFGQRALPDLSEMGIVCNHLSDFDPDIPEFHFPVARTLEIPEIMSPAGMGGILSGKMRIDVVNCLRRSDEQSMEGGVYVVVECDDRETWDVLRDKGVPVSRSGKSALIYYPAHYLGFESIFSVLSVGLLGMPTSSRDPRPRYDLAARAVKRLKAGTCLEARGHHHIIDGFEGLLLPAKSIAGNTQLPYYLAHGTVLKNDIEAGTLLTMDMLDIPDSALLWKLREEQDREFLD